MDDKERIEELMTRGIYNGIPVPIMISIMELLTELYKGNEDRMPLSYDILKENMNDIITLIHKYNYECTPTTIGIVYDFIILK